MPRYCREGYCSTTAVRALDGFSAADQRTSPTNFRAHRPGAAQGANSDGYAECMAMWSPANTRMSQQEWTKTCDNGRLKQR